MVVEGLSVAMEGFFFFFHEAFPIFNAIVVLQLSIRE
jgi:hypothetical protein